MAPKMLTLVWTIYAFWWINIPEASCATVFFPSCHPVIQKVSLEKDGCLSCHIVEAAICEGYCFNKDPVYMDAPWLTGPQKACVYEEVHYEKFKLSNCLPGVDPWIKYPVAISCKCKGYSPETTHNLMTPNDPDQCLHDDFGQDGYRVIH
ncbi:gonadotropin subunit beta-2-like [Dunckerocampus dactyliophorus]|uniref:gonadotropin subunit beta-2-like n=1 Tax=Dunckerocampus dactyliophorus TaxID=161453 RepID=UPI0024063570|nr:gonadotropin subunit beta-2-like [Dunckerocampus dactyliophorus]